MTPEQMASDAVIAINNKTNMTLVLPRPFKRPPKFPRADELLCEQKDSNVYSYNPEKILAWLVANKLIKMEIKQNESTNTKTDAQPCENMT